MYITNFIPEVAHQPIHNNPFVHHKPHLPVKPAQILHPHPPPFGHGAESFNHVPHNAPATRSSSKCQQPAGIGSYTCISFGSPVTPIFAYHMRHGKDGVFVGNNSGFPGKRLVARRRRRRRLPKASIKNSVENEIEATESKYNKTQESMDNHSLGSMIQANIQPYEYPLQQSEATKPRSSFGSDLIFVTPLPPVASGGDGKGLKTTNGIVTPTPSHKIRKKKKLDIIQKKTKYQLEKHMKEISDTPKRPVPPSYKESTKSLIEKKKTAAKFPSVFEKTGESSKSVPRRTYPTSYSNLGGVKNEITVFSL